ncbi:M28 family peptidase [Sphingobium mellinum]|uniref:M28 family peptidase n=1 Tax=Sphingobium mellinum TaxID=1387166 RepID=UPI0030EEA835
MQKNRSAAIAAIFVTGILSSISSTAAQVDDAAWRFVEGLTTEIGPRPAGTAQEARARDWAVDSLKALGFSQVRAEPYVMPVWQRDKDEVEVISPFPQKLVLAALGNSASTPAKGISGDIIYFPTLAALEAAPDVAVRGKIVFIDHAMHATQDGSSYGYFGATRRQGPSIATRKGAIAILIRSIGTDNHRLPHSGVQMWAEGVKPIPAAALSIPDADQLGRILARGKPVRVHLTLISRLLKDQPSGNVIAEIPGTDPAAGIVLAACHLDSWDQGTGAIDDAAGCGIIAAAALKASEDKPLRRTIRLLMAGAEEVGGDGARAYFADHGQEGHVAALESDFGADRVWRVDFKLPAALEPLRRRITAGLAPLGIAPGTSPANGGSDIEPLVKAGVPVVDLQQDGTRYFDIHHTADDTLDKIDSAQLQQNVAAWAIVLREIANAPESLAIK